MTSLNHSFSGRSRFGFTLVELLVVISIIGILASLLMVNFSGLRERGRDSSRKSNLSQVKTALRLYYNDFQTYPADNNNGVIMGCVNGTQACQWGSTFSANGTTYMVLPTDPIGDPEYEYEQTNSGNGFIIRATLENESDPQAAESQLRCGVAQAAVEDGIYMICAE